MKPSKTVTARLADLGLALPSPVTPLGNYASGVRTGQFIFFSGHGPLRVNGKPAFQGHVGAEFSTEQAGVILIGATLNLLSSAQRILGDLGLINSIVEAHAIVACANSQVDIQAAAAPAFELQFQLFGSIKSRQITRATSLPNGVPVLMEAIATVDEVSQ